MRVYSASTIIGYVSPKTSPKNYVEPGASPENDPRSKYEGVD